MARRSFRTPTVLPSDCGAADNLFKLGDTFPTGVSKRLLRFIRLGL